MGTTSRYVPYDYRRTCDVCGNLRNRSQMVERPGSVFVCSYHPGERTELELSQAIAATTPIRILPVPNPKPQDQDNPNVFEAAEGVILNFVDQQITNQVRFENVTSGDGAPVSGSGVSGCAWACRYLYDMILENKRPLRFINRGKALLQTAATFIITRQRGFGISPSSTRATDAFYGAFLEVGGGSYSTATNSICGLACLYAYRILGTSSFLDSARACASYLRNVQAIGSNGSDFTSQDAGQTVRLYTGGLLASVSTAAGFHGNQLFFISGILALETWNELKLTDGDQDIGATAAVTGFSTAPNQSLSQSILDVRNCWANGITDATGTTLTGLSSTTPREMFNAFPSGTGRWEFADGDASTGTTVSSQPYALALAVLFAYEGNSSQVSTINAWLRSFTSNSAYQTAAGTSDAVLARAQTGTYDPTITLSTMLLVRDSTNSYASIAKNGSSLYDWSCLGLLAPIWSSSFSSTFAAARRSVLGPVQRYKDGRRSDGDYFDQISLRSVSGLTYQTAFNYPASLMTNDVVGAAMFGKVFRYGPRTFPAQA